MSEESVKRFSDEINNIVNYYADEFDIMTSEIIGVLTMTIMDIYSGTPKEGEEEDND